MGRFDARVVVITGAARGIGLGTATRFAEEGASVAVVDLDESAAAEAAGALPVTDGASAVGIGCDVSDGESAKAAIERTVSELGGIHVLVNNAGVTRSAMVHRMTEEDWDLVLDVCLRGTVNGFRAVAPWFRDKGRRPRRVVSVSSLAGTRGGVGGANYAAAKAGVVGLTRTMALEWAPFNVAVNAIAPGVIDTPFFRRHLDTAADPERFLAAREQRNPLGRLLDPDEVAATVEFAALDARGMTGSVLTVDAGLSASFDFRTGAEGA